MVRNDLANGEMTEPVQVTSKQGENFEDVCFGVNSDGTLKALAIKSVSDIVTREEFNESIEEANELLPEKEQMKTVSKKDYAPYNDVSPDKNLVALDITPISRAKLRNTDNLLDGVKADSDYNLEVGILNDGIDKLDELTLTATDKDGNGIVNDNGKIVKSKKVSNIIGGRLVGESLKLVTGKDDEKAEINLTLTDKEGKEVDKKTLSKTFEDELILTDGEASLTSQRDEFDLSFKAENIGSKASKEHNVEYGVIDRNDKKVKLGETALRALDVSDEETVVLRGIQADSAEYFNETTDEYGNLTETGTFYVSDGDDFEKFTVERKATQNQVEAMKNVKNVSFSENGKVEAYKNDLTALNLTVDGKPISQLSGVRTIYQSENDDIFTANPDNGSIYGIKNGTGKLTATILPENSEVTGTFSGSEGKDGLTVKSSDNYAKLPSSLVKTFTTDVTVSEQKPTEPTTPTEPSKKTIKNGVTYKVSGKTAVISKSDKKASKLTIPNTVTIGKKKYKVTKINAGVFKSSKKLTSVSIGNNITSIGKQAFYGCKKLSKVTFRKTSKVKTIGASAFANCKKLKKITIPKSVRKIDSKAFYKDSALAKITFKRKTPLTIGKNAFKGIAKKAVFDVPDKSLKKYLKKLTKSKGVTKKMTVK